MAVRAFAPSIPALPTDDWLPPPSAPAAPLRSRAESDAWVARRRPRKDDRGQFVAGLVGGVFFAVVPAVLLMERLVS